MKYLTISEQRTYLILIFSTGNKYYGSWKIDNFIMKVSKYLRKGITISLWFGVLLCSMMIGRLQCNFLSRVRMAVFSELKEWNYQYLNITLIIRVEFINLLIKENLPLELRSLDKIIANFYYLFFFKIRSKDLKFS